MLAMRARNRRSGADGTGLPAGAGIDQVAFNLGGTEGVVYGLGEPPLGMHN
jgi:hypothetical protein